MGDAVDLKVAPGKLPKRLPVLLSYIQGIVDERQDRGMFILTGSHQPDARQAVSQTLAGRTAILQLLPFSMTELRNYKRDWQTYDLLVTGNFPRIHQEKLTPARFYNSYIQTYVERDVRTLINVKDLDQFQRFLILIAGRTGQIVNYTSLGNDIGLSGTAVKKWISVLKASYVVFELPPFFENIKKRVVKSPKIYFTDTGLVAHLLGIETTDQAYRDPLRGNLYENFIILEIYKKIVNQGKRPDLFFFRDTQGNEVDLVIRRHRRLIPIEIKSSATFSNAFIKNLSGFRKLAGQGCDPGYVFYDGKTPLSVKDVQIQNILIHGLPEDLQ